MIWPPYARAIGTLSQGQTTCDLAPNFDFILEFLEFAPRTTLRSICHRLDSEILRQKFSGDRRHRERSRRDGISGTAPVRMWQQQDSMKEKAILQCSFSWGFSQPYREFLILKYPFSIPIWRKKPRSLCIWGPVIEYKLLSARRPYPEVMFPPFGHDSS